MTNVGGPRKTLTRRLLVDSCFQVLEREGWDVAKVSGFGNSRVRRISKDGTSKLIAIRTTQDQWIAFPRTKDDARWATLSDVDAVVVASVDPDDEKSALVHMIDANELRGRFDKAYAARLNAGHTIPLGRGVWVALYENEAAEPVSLVGAGSGLTNKPLARVRLPWDSAPAASPPVEAMNQGTGASGTDEGTLTIAEAKSRLARTLGVDPSSIKITVEA